MTSLTEQQLYERRIKFYAARIDTCGYRLYDMIQTRRKEIPKLQNAYKDEDNQQAVESLLLSKANTFINCLTGEHHSQEIPEYLQPAADEYKSLYYTRLAPKFVLEEEQLKLVKTIFEHVQGRK